MVLVSGIVTPVLLRGTSPSSCCASNLGDASEMVKERPKSPCRTEASSSNQRTLEVRS